MSTQRQTTGQRRQVQRQEMTPQERRRLQRLRQEKRRRRRRALLCRFAVIAVGLTILVCCLPPLVRWGYDKALDLYQILVPDENGNDSSQQVGGSVMTGDEAAGIRLTFGSVDPQVMEVLEDRYAEEDQAAKLFTHTKQYPDELLTLLSKRPETLEFVLGYPKEKNKPVEVDLRGEIKKGIIPRLYQWDPRWGYGIYGDNLMALAGCGPTCLSMVLLGLTGDSQWHPYQVATFSQEHGYVSQAGTSWELMSVGAGELGLHCQELPLDENRMIRELKDGHPIICSMRPGDFTDTGHFIVLVDYKNGGFVVNDPNSIGNSDKIWNYEEIRGQIRNLWAFSLK